jgi:hypothetical protein
MPDPQPHAKKGLLAWVERHPFITAGGVFAVGALIILYYYGEGGAAGVNTESSDYQAALAAQTQLAQTEAQYGAQESIAGSQAQAAANQVQGQVDVAQIQETGETTEAQYAEQLGSLETAAQTAIQTAGIGAQEALGVNAQNNQTVQLAAQYNTEDYLATVGASTTDYQTQAQSLTNSELISALAFLGANKGG